MLAEPHGVSRRPGVTVVAGSSIDVGKLIADETEKLAKVIRANNIKAE
jgi:hypothetical protein